MENFKVLKYESEDFPGYSYIKVYNKNANKENMINEIKSIINVDKKHFFWLSSWYPPVNGLVITI